ncbi:tripartite tricarboxylate transporter permease [Pseudonocardia kongjuensis]
MLDALGSGLLMLLTPAVLAYLLLGVLIGLLVGVLPGLGGPAALALVLPFTFGMETAEAFALMLGLVSVVALAGDLTAVLIGVPGEAVSAAMIMDGYPMTKRGEAGRALGIMLTACLVGAVFGLLIILLLIPVIRPLVLRLQSPELFMLTLLGLSFVAVLSRGSRLKALIAGGIGLLIATVGMDPQTGIARFTFGEMGLWDGIGIVSVAMGLFAIPELLQLFLNSGSGSTRPMEVGGARRGVLDVVRHWWLTLRCSALGAAVGIVPGLGGAAGQWVAYGYAVQTTKDKRRFGKGAVEGVIGPAAANNSKEGGSLITTIAFGLPGGTMMAILLGGLLIQGLVPGPAMLDEQLPLTMSFLWIILFANIVAVAICLPLAGRIAWLTNARASVLVPVITVFIYVGAFAEERQLVDVWLMLIFGAIGIVMVSCNWPRPPLILGLVLGDLAERYLFRSVAGDDWNWVTRPSVIVIAVVIAFVVLSGTTGFGRVISRRVRRAGPVKVGGE